jgi:hypothetical protein
MTLNFVPTTWFKSCGLWVAVVPAPVPPIVVSLAIASAMVFTLLVCHVNATSTSELTRPIQLNFPTWN